MPTAVYGSTYRADSVLRLSDRIRARPADRARLGATMTAFDIQAGGSNHHYGRIAHWLGVALWRRFPDATVNIKVGTAYRDLSAVGDGLAHIGVATPALAARPCL